MEKTAATQQTRDTSATSRQSKSKPTGFARVTSIAHSRIERLIAGVPARIMRPRLIFIFCAAALVCFGLLMVYSASSVEALKEVGSSTYYLERQALFAAIGGLFALALARGIPFTLDRLRASSNMILLVLIVLLGAVFLFSGSGGAYRWIYLGSFTLQPSEFAKPLIIVIAAKVFSAYFEERSIDLTQLAISLAVGVLIPLALIFLEPDTGTTIIIALTVIMLAVLSGLPMRLIVGIGGVVLLLFVAAIAAEPYRVTRVLVASDPWSDPYGTGYQATLAIMAFASGGLFGRGIGNSTMKYSYLPEAHNDFILAIIGEELGFVGTALFIAVFLLMVYAAFKVAQHSPSLYAKLIAAGCGFILGLQFFVNVLGILGVTPMTGKTLPFISYGGSSMIASLMLVGLVVRVSVESTQDNLYRVRRERFAVLQSDDLASDTSAYLGTSGAAAPVARSVHPRPAREHSFRTSAFRIYEGGATASFQDSTGAQTWQSRRGVAGAGQDAASFSHHTRLSSQRYTRIDLGEDPRDRLRTRQPPQSFSRASQSGATQIHNSSSYVGARRRRHDDEDKGK